MRISLSITLAFLFVAQIIGVSSAAAEQTYFLVRSGKDSAVHFEVTDAVIAKVGTTTYKAMIPGMDDAFHVVRGPLMRDLLKAAGVSGNVVSGVALDRYVVDIPARDFDTYDVIAAIEIDGKPITVREKGPAWIVYPSFDHPELQKDAVYEARSIWQLKEIVVE